MIRKTSSGLPSCVFLCARQRGTVLNSCLRRQTRRSEMKAAVVTVLLSLAPLILTSCETSAKRTSTNSNVNTNKPAPAPPTADALLALDKQANEAYFKADSKFFERTLSDNFITREGGLPMDKAAFVKLVANNRCDVKT